MGNADGDKTQLKVPQLLKYFQTRLEDGEGTLKQDSLEPITFLEERQRRSVHESVKALQGLFHKVEEKRPKEGENSGEGESGEQGNKNRNPGDILDPHEVHEEGRKLWTLLMRAAIANIDPNAKGHSELLRYLKAATEFEDLLYGLEPFYRDHTLHSLWVYLIGVKLMGKEGELEPIAQDLNWYVYNDVRAEEHPGAEALVSWARLEKDCLDKEIQKKRDAIWCIMALCHDLGYSLAKLEKLNEKVQTVLEFYDVSDFRHVGYTLDLEHQYLVAQCLELMAMDVRITPEDGYPEDVEDGLEEKLLNCIKGVKKLREEKPNEHLQRDTLRLLLNTAVSSAYADEPNNKKEVEKPNNKKEEEEEKKLEYCAQKMYDNVLTKCFRDDASYWRLCKALERKEHGVLSAYLLYKTMGLFADTSVRSTAEGWGLDDDEAVDNIIRGDILFGIAQHEFAFAHIDQMSSLAEILILCDELEEFTRLGRPLHSRKYHATTADTWVRVELDSDKKKPRPNRRDIRVAIAMTYHSRHEKREEFFKFCWRKAGRLCRLFSLVPDKREKPANDEKVYLISKIESTFEYYDDPRDVEDDEKDARHEVVFTMRDNTADPKKEYAVEITLPTKKQKNPIELECRDDDIYVVGSTSLEDFELEKQWHWIGVADRNPPDDSRLVKLLWEVFKLEPKELPEAKK